MRRNEDEMDNQKLADLLFPEVVNTPEYYEEKFPYRKLPNKAEVIPFLYIKSLRP